MAAQKYKWHQTRQGFALLALLAFAAAYVCASLALDSGSLLQWTAAFALLAAGIQNAGKLAIALWKHE